MTSRRFTRRVRNPVRRVFATQAATSADVTSNMIDLTIQAELASTSDSRTGDVLVTGVALIDLTDEAAIHQMSVWVGRTSTEPAPEDTGVRTRQYPANSQGIPFVFRVRGLRIDPGMQLRLTTQAIVETVGTVIHQNVVSVKFTFRELPKG